MKELMQTLFRNTWFGNIFSLKSTGAPATKADTMMSSLRFALHILGAWQVQ
jgi:hypothetical protein